MALRPPRLARQSAADDPRVVQGRSPRRDRLQGRRECGRGEIRRNRSRRGPSALGQAAAAPTAGHGRAFDSGPFSSPEPALGAARAARSAAARSGRQLEVALHRSARRCRRPGPGCPAPQRSRSPAGDLAAVSQRRAWPRSPSSDGSGSRAALGGDQERIDLARLAAASASASIVMGLRDASNGPLRSLRSAHQVGAAAEALAEVGRQRPDVRPRAEHSTEISASGDFGSARARAVDRHPLRLALDLLALAGELVQRHAVLLHRAVHRRDLLDLAEELSRAPRTARPRVGQLALVAGAAPRPRRRACRWSSPRSHGARRTLLRHRRRRTKRAWSPRAAASGNTPVAWGSRVPRWPMRRVAEAAASARSTTSCDWS